MSHKILDVQIDDLPLSEVRAKITGWLEHDHGKVIVTPNAEMLVQSRSDEQLRSRLNRADLAVADTVSLRYAVAALSHDQMKNRIPGVDLLQVIAELCAVQDKQLVLLGGAPGAALGASKKIGGVAIDPGNVEFDGIDAGITDSLIDELRQQHPDVVAVGLGHGKQEAFIEAAKTILPDVRIWIGVGGSFDMISGMRRRAPKVLRSMGLEWLWRLMIEPSRWRRIANAAIVFPWMVAWITLKRGTILSATGRVFKEVYRQFRKI
jgi:N-acetylglucosaminyldiphosphoundecaprenol N-acetyl-beta-D-mannosaminyltransferase